MEEAASAERYPVVFFDGEQDTRIQDVVVLPTLNFKALQSMISERIGIAPHQFSVFLANRERRGSRIPVTAKTNFSEICRRKGWFFLAVLKRSRSERRRSGREMTAESIKMFRFDPSPVNSMLWTRDGNLVAINRNGLSMDRVEYRRRVRELEVEKERYLMNMGLGSSLGVDSGWGLKRPSLGEIERGDRDVVCDECLLAKRTGMDPGFHWCIYDTVTFGFRSSAGPIARPVKRHS